MSRPSRDHACLAELHRRGGVAHRQTLVGASSENALASCARRGAVVPLGGGVYVSPLLADLLLHPPASPGWHAAPGEASLLFMRACRAVALSMRGAVCGRSAALAHGWALLEPPREVEVAVPRGRHVRPWRGPGRVAVHRRDLDADELVSGVASELNTVVEAGTRLPRQEAVPLIDSALRVGGVTREELAAAARGRRGPGAARLRATVALVDGRAANPFESLLRLVLRRVDGATFVPQVEVRGPDWFARVDLADVDHRLIVEGDSYAFHGGVEAFRRDMARYNRLVAAGWTVLRFGLDDVLHRPDAVVDHVQAVIASGMTGFGLTNRRPRSA